MPGTDDWTTDDSSYSPSNFYTTTKDSQKESVNYSLRIPGATYSRMQKLVESRQLSSYETISDIIRDAIHHRIQYLETEKMVSRDDTLRRARIIQERINEEIHNSRFEDNIRDLNSTVSSLLREGYFPRAKKLISDILQEIQGMEDSWWKEKYLRSLKSYFPQLVQEVLDGQ